MNRPLKTIGFLLVMFAFAFTFTYKNQQNQLDTIKYNRSIELTHYKNEVDSLNQIIAELSWKLEAQKQIAAKNASLSVTDDMEPIVSFTTNTY